MIFFFFSSRRRHTRWPRDWSSDVCSSDLLLTPKAEANNLYSWLLNFQVLNDEYKKRYEQSKEYEENDIYIFSDPSWEHEDYPDGLSYIDSEHNVAIILGLQYFGELKKGTLTQAWGTAARHASASS